MAGPLIAVAGVCASGKTTLVNGLLAHGYRARESVGHTLWEMTRWLDQYVKNAGPRAAAP